MAQRLRLYDCRASRLPPLIGLCQDNIPQIASYVNSAQRRLIYCKEAGNDGWYGTFAEMVFTVDPANPYITTPRSVARIISHTWCNRYVPLQNIYYSYLTFGNGRMTGTCDGQCSDLEQTFSRNNVVTFTDLTNLPVLIRIYITESTDLGKRALIQGLDSNNTRIYTQDGLNRADGIFVDFDQPFVTTTIQWNQILGIQKDVTDGDVQFFQVDPTTGDETLLLTMEPGETTASYRRYYLHNLPSSCCPAASADGTVQVTAIVKLDLIPVAVDTDWCLIQNLEAIIEECQAIRYSEMDSGNAKQMTDYHHRNAVRLLNGELNHFIGSEQAAIGFKPFGSASLRRQRIGILT